ncbi:MAG: methyltransferase domain-containing protein [Planctomycetes bacterium]|nr:methyltransferase domain-containing protein [Planctomycetota bacterium]
MPSEHRVFFRQFVRNFQTTGSLAPSSRTLARALTRFVAEHPTDGTKRAILEVGPGTGAITRELVKRLAPNDHLTLVELNDEFVAHLRHRFDHESAFQAVKHQATIVHDRLENLPSGSEFEVIVSGLPLNNFPVQLVREILTVYRRLLRPGGTLSFFEYMAIRPLRARVGSRQQRERLAGISDALHELFAAGRIRCEWVWGNLPPAWAHHIRLG